MKVWILKVHTPSDSFNTMTPLWLLFLYCFVKNASHSCHSVSRSSLCRWLAPFTDLQRTMDYQRSLLNSIKTNSSESIRALPHTVYACIQTCHKPIKPSNPVYIHRLISFRPPTTRQYTSSTCMFVPSNRHLIIRTVQLDWTDIQHISSMKLNQEPWSARPCINAYVSITQPPLRDYIPWRDGHGHISFVCATGQPYTSTSECLAHMIIKLNL